MPEPGLFDYFINGSLPPGATESFIVTAHVDPNYTGLATSNISAYGGYDLFLDNNNVYISDTISAP
jgi:hypothetical protein